MLKLRWRFGQATMPAPIISELFDNWFWATTALGESTAGGNELRAHRFCMRAQAVDGACARAYAAPALILANVDATPADPVVFSNTPFNSRPGHGLKGGGRGRAAWCGFLLFSLVHRMIANHLYA